MLNLKIMKVSLMIVKLKEPLLVELFLAMVRLF